MYRKGAQVRCWDKLDVKYLCGDKRPSGRKSRQRGPSDGKPGKPKEEESELTGRGAAQHSSNHRNRNQIRRTLAREIYKMERREDVSCERRGTEIRRLQEQLKAYQRPPRPKCEQRRAEGRAKQGKGVSTHRAQRQRWKGVAIHSACVVHHVTVLRKARGRRYGVTSNGRKFHGLR